MRKEDLVKYKLVRRVRRGRLVVYGGRGADDRICSRGHFCCCHQQLI